MNAEEQLKELKRKPQLTKEEKRRSLARAIVLATAIVGAILFFMYGSVQRIEAQKNAELALELRVQLLEQRKKADELQAEAEKQRMIATMHMTELQQCAKSKK